MSEFTMVPNLPVQAEIVLIGSKYYEMLAEPLKKQGITAISVPDNPDVDKRLSGHCDLSVLHGGGNKLFMAPYLRGSSFEDTLRRYGADLVYPDIEQRPAYPNDAQLNLCVVGKRFLYSARVSSTAIVNYFTNVRGLLPLKVRQGYARCSVCVVDGNSIITADRGIASAAESVGLDTLIIASGGIELSGFACGFIGGTAFKLSTDTLAFTGRLDRHPDGEKITAFLKERGVKPVFLTDRPAFDIGSAVPFT